MRNAVLLILTGLACSAIAQNYLKISFYDDLDDRLFGVPLSYFPDELSTADVYLNSIMYEYFPQEITEFIFVYKDDADNFFHAYYVSESALSKNSSNQFMNVIHDFMKSGEFYVLSPMAVMRVAPEYLNTPVKDMQYDSTTEIDFDKRVPLFFIIPKSHIPEPILYGVTPLVDIELNQRGVIKITNKPTVDLPDTAFGNKDGLKGESKVGAAMTERKSGVTEGARRRGKKL